MAAITLGCAGDESPTESALEAEPAREYHLVFASDSDGDEDVYAVGTRGGRVAALTRNDVDDSFLAVSPSGSFFVSRGHAFLVSGDGRRARNLGHADSDVVFPADGSQLAYARESANFEHVRLAVVPVGGGPIRYLGSDLYPEAFSSDGRYLAYSGGGFGVIDLRTAERTRFPWLSDEESVDVWSPQLTRVASLEFPALSDGRLIVAGARPRSPARALEGTNWGEPTWLDDDRFGVTRGREIVVVDLQADTQTVVASSGTSPDGPFFRDVVWSPRRDAVAYFEGDESTGSWDAVVAPLDGAETRVEIPGRTSPSGLEWSAPFGLEWSASGDAIAFHNGHGELYVLQLASSPRLVRVTRGIRNFLSLEWSPDGRTFAIRWPSSVTLVSAEDGAKHTVAGLGNVGLDLFWVRGPVPRAAAAATSPIQLDTSTKRLHRRLPTSGTLVSVAGSVSALAQDGSRLAWVRNARSSTARFTSVVEMVDVARRTQTTIGGTRRDPSELNPGLHPASFAVAGTRVLLIHLNGGVCGLSGCEFDVLTASLPDRRLRLVDSSYYDIDLVNRGLPVLTTGDAGTIVYYAGVLRRLSGRSPVTIVRLKASFLTALAYGGGRLALAERKGERGATTVSVRAVDDGALIRRFSMPGRVTSLALSPTRVVALASRGGQTWIELRDARNGSVLGRVDVPRASSTISISGDRIVFHAGKAIRLLDARTRRISTLTTAASDPIGLSIEGARVAWAESLNNRARIRAITLGMR